MSVYRTIGPLVLSNVLMVLFIIMRISKSFSYRELTFIHIESDGLLCISCKLESVLFVFFR